ncbi:protein FAM178B-like isoform X2 [Peromyscus leucopus]|uniref:protein FAM178B-like isoform X2 n=1 Tax=Peromyscus leucopus TaxID=10041 RepID=UPI001884AD6F|nr:protein FAM178B-like isoform X2 [Peromyscus leucopus]
MPSKDDSWRLTEDSMVSLLQVHALRVCYLCHSLLTLAGVVVSSQDITPDQWGELQLLCMQLDRHISTHIRESPQAMHRTKLKDLATQTYIRWQDLLAHCQPQGQYFSPWKDI